MTTIDTQILLINLSFSLLVFLISIRVEGFIFVLIRRLLKLKFWKRFSKVNESYWPAVIPVNYSNLESYILWSGIKKYRVINSIFFAFIICIFLSLVLGLFFSTVFFALFCVTQLSLLQLQAGRQKKKFIKQLPESLSALSSSLRAGYSLSDSVGIVERETEIPVSLVYGALRRSFVYGYPLNETLRMLDGQINLAEWNLVTESLLIQSKVGGNLIPVIASVSRTLRDKQVVEGEINSSTAAGKMSGIVLALLAPLSFLVMHYLAPEYVSVFYTTGIGKFLLLVASCMEVLGFITIMKIIKVDF